MRSLTEVLDFFGLPQIGLNTHINNICTDSRHCSRDDLFIAYKGDIADGHDFIDNAIENGAKIILAEHKVITSVPIIVISSIKLSIAEFAAWFYDYPSLNFNLISVTGTNGKTTVSHYFAQLLTLLGTKIGLLGTIGNGVWPDIHNSELTTLDCCSLHAKLDKLKSKVDTLIMEVSSHALSQDRIMGLKFKVAIWTNLSQDHLDYHFDMTSYFAAKMKLFLDYTLEVAIINIDDSYGRELIALLIAKRPNLKIIKYSIIDEQADLYLGILNQNCDGYKINIKNHLEIQQCSVPIIGNYNLQNIAAVIALLNIYFEINLSKIATVMPKLQCIKGRLEIITKPGKPKVIIDFAHTPDGLNNVLEAISYLKPKKLWCTFGCGGNRDKSKRALMAQVVESYANNIIVTEDNSRFEDFNDISMDIIKGFKTNKYIIIKKRKMALEYVLKHAAKDDIILLAGKGHETYLDIMGKKTYFDERNVILKFWETA